MSSKLTSLPGARAREPILEPGETAACLTLRHRPRRNRKAEWSRRLVRECQVSVDDLIWPMFVIEGTGRREPVASMPLVDRLTVDEAVREAERAAALGIP